jgi:hypothetical protein
MQSRTIKKQAVMIAFMGAIAVWGVPTTDRIADAQQQMMDCYSCDMTIAAMDPQDAMNASCQYIHNTDGSMDYCYLEHLAGGPLNGPGDDDAMNYCADWVCEVTDEEGNVTGGFVAGIRATKATCEFNDQFNHYNCNAAGGWFKVYNPCSPCY